MKKMLLPFFLMATLSMQATIRTVNNNPSGLAQYSDLQTAIDASAQGDTLYIHGSNVNYGSAFINDKKLTLMGPGIAPDKLYPLQAMVNFIRIRNINNYNANGCVVIGLTFYQALQLSINSSSNNDLPVSNVKVIRNRFITASGGIDLQLGASFGSKTINGFYAEGNYFENGGGIQAYTDGFYNDLTIENNVFQRNSGFWGSRFIGGLNNCSNVRIDHNVFYAAPGLAADSKRCFNEYMANLDFRNNIFINVDILATNNLFSSNLSNSVFSNNITYNCVNNTPWVGNGNTSNGGNIANQDPQMVSQADINNGVNNPLLDFSILSGPANNAASDGKDIGVLFDETTTANWAYGRNTRLPYINELTILNPTLPAGSTLNIQLKARKAK